MFNLPPMTKALLIANVAVHGARFLLPTGLDNALLETFAFVPDRYVTQDGLSWPALLSPITYQFLHGGLTHLGVNMLSLVAFGAGVEQRLGARWLLAFYLFCGVVAAFTQFAIGPSSTDLLIGASGAISGLFGAVLRFRVQQKSLWIIVAVWLAMNLLSGQQAIIGSDIGPVAWVAHIGGFVAGLVLFPIIDRRRSPGT
jgi:membrane associated rhomboid family serine protease